MTDLRPRVPQTFWQRLQDRWREPSQTISDFSDFQSHLLRSGIDLTNRDAHPFATALRDREGHLRPRRKSLHLHVDEQHLNSIRTYQKGVYGGHDENDVAVTFVRVGLENL